MSPRPPASLSEFFWARVDRRESDECWPWTGVRDSNGYGQGRIGGRGGKMWRGHQMAYVIAHGSIPDGLEIDHLCRDHGCVNPAHLEAVTHLENIRRGRWQEAYLEFRARKTHCKRGHGLFGANLLASKDGHRRCKECHRLRAEWKRAA